MNTDTPRTDEAFLDIYAFCKEDMIPAIEFARQLETELTAVTEQRDRLAEALWNMLNQEHGSAIKAGILLRSLNLQYLNPNDKSEL